MQARRPLAASRFPASSIPATRTIWIDWDAAYEAHSEAWGRHARVEREVARRENAWEYAVERVMNPFAGRLKDGELELAERTHHERKAAAAEQERQMRAAAEAAMVAQGFTTSKEETDEIKRSAEELKRIHRTGRKTTATVVGQRETGRRLGPIAAIEIIFDVDDGGTVRRVTYEHLFGPRAAKRYKPGRPSRCGSTRPIRTRSAPGADQASTAIARGPDSGVGLAGSQESLTSERGCR